MSSSSAPRRLLLTVYPPDGGAARHVVDLVTGLAPDDWSVDLMCLPGSDPWRALEPRSNVTVHPLPGAHGRPGPRDLGSLSSISSLARSADVIHAHSSKAGFLTRLGAALVGRRQRVIFTPHGWSFWAASGVEAHLYQGLERMAAHWCRTIVTVSEAERSAGLSAGIGKKSQYQVILNGIDLDSFTGIRRPEAGRILWVGRLAHPKSPDIAVQALDLLRRTYASVSLQIVGDGPLRGDVEAQLLAMDLVGAVQLLGVRHDIPELLSRAACFVLTSGYEGCPLSVMEAMAAGVPVVATAVGGVPELVVDGKTGILVEPNRPEAIAAAVGELLSDPARCEALGRAGLEHAHRHFGRGRMVADVVSLYEETIAEPR